MIAENVQVLFFQQLKTQLPPHLSMVDEIAGLLGISTDSAYRRIRGEKPIDLEEAQKLCVHFKVSLDQLMHLKSDAFIFTGNLNASSDHAFEEWLTNLQKQLESMSSFKKKHIYFLVKDIPPFLHFQIPELASFKFFLWMKSILHYESFKGVRFSIDDTRYQPYLDASRRVIELYNKIPTTEIWNVESINSTLRQIDFLHEAGAFIHKEEVKLLYNKVAELIDHIEREAESGVKFTLGRSPRDGDPEYRLLVNELIFGDNTFMAELDDMRVTYLNHSVLFFVGTRDESFNKAMFLNLENIIRKSTLISSVGEKQRNQFFNRMRRKIDNCIAGVR
jgi:hypothetical protein